MLQRVVVQTGAIRLNVVLEYDYYEGKHECFPQGGPERESVATTEFDVLQTASGLRIDRYVVTAEHCES